MKVIQKDLCNWFPNIISTYANIVLVLFYSMVRRKLRKLSQDKPGMTNDFVLQNLTICGLCANIYTSNVFSYFEDTKNFDNHSSVKTVPMMY